MSAHRVARPTVRTAKLVAWLAIPAALLLSGAVVATGSYSAFSATTVNPSSNWTTGTVVLADDDSNAALFNVTGLKPGSTGSNCITVTSTGTLASAVKLYATSAATGTLAPYVSLKIEQGTSATATTFGTCTGFTGGTTIYNGTASAFNGTASSFANGIGSWSPTGTGSENRVYKFTYTVDSGLTNTYQNATAALGFTWEAQNS